MSENAPLPEKSDSVLREERVLAFWKEQKIFDKSLLKKSPAGEFIFFEGPPTANAKPAVHHLASRAFKDALPRYKTMRGFHVPRRAGWDTHGLPVELQIEKALGFTGKKDIEEYGIAEFNEQCRESVFTYIEEWEKFTERIGYWVDQENAYFTFDPNYMESVWALVKQISDADRLYQDYKVLPWCSRCGTALSSHELAQGYEDVKDLSVTVQFEVVGEEHAPKTYLLAWTTTPWTLPGNVALVVGEKIAYVYAKNENGTYIVAKDLVEKVFAGQSFEIVQEVSGKDLIGMQYKPLFTYAQEIASETEKPKFEKAFQVYPASFVTTEEGTGIVHTAVMYGQDDFEVGTALGLPKVHTVGVDGRFVPDTGYLEGRFVKEQDDNGKPTLAVDIIDDLKSRGLFFSQENHKHSYPFCWRCKTPLIYYARDSWYIRMHDLREQMVAENQKINWEPNYIRDGRMGDWLSGAKEWALSRERYWGTPLPVWENRETKERVVVGSIEDMRTRTKRSGNTYFIMRHGQAENNVLRELDSSNTKKWPLTEAGRAQVLAQAETLKGAGLTKIITSPFERTQQTAKLIANHVGFSEDHITIDERIREMHMGELDGTPHHNLTDFRTDGFFNQVMMGGGESALHVKRRFGAFLYDLEATYQNETILIVTHGIGCEVMPGIVAGANLKESERLMCAHVPGEAELQRFDFVPLPHNEDFELDLHRPYIDDVVLVSEKGTELTRVKEVMDVWFDSGAMPYAQDHYPFENKEWIDGKGFPADYISEAIDQTRGWFYTLLAIGVLTGHGAPYKNVICLGHLLDAEGKKMSKSKGNIVNPWEAIEKYGADTLRLWMYWVNQPGDSKSFDDKTLKEAARILSWFENSAKFYALFATESETADVVSENVLDQWMITRTNVAVEKVTTAMDAYLPYDATRAIGELLEDLSQWYVRRIRDRAREGDQSALSTLRSTLRTSALLLAPFTPFIAEDIFMQVKFAHDPESVHLADWPKVSEEIDTERIDAMNRIRTIASEGLMLRQKSNIKVRQPLASLSITEEFSPELQEILKEELNVENIITASGAFELDTVLTPDLIEKGDVRAFMRAVADARKSKDLQPKDLVTLHVHHAEGETVVGFMQGVSLPGVSSIVYGAKAGTGAIYKADVSLGTVSFSLTV